MTTIETKLGTLEARASNDPNYPGIYVGLHRGEKWMEFALVEADQLEDEPTLKVHGYNATDDEPVFYIHESAENIRRVFDED